MKKSLKAGILITILGIPALAFILLKVFSKNNFDIPYYFPEINEQGEAVVINGDTAFSTIKQFKLLDQNSDTLQYSPGDITVVNFFFSRCGSICPIMNSNLAKVADQFKKHKDVQFLGITVDPKFDTPDVLKTYGRGLGIEGLNYHLLTGDKAYIYNLCLRNFKLPVADASEYDQNIKDIDEMFIHSEKVLLIDKKGYIRGIYDGTIEEDIDRLKVEIKVLLSQEEIQ